MHKQHDRMKTISLDEEAYHVLKGLKLGPQDSFSAVVKRHFGGQPDLEASAGGWGDVPPERLEELRRERTETFGTTADLR